MPELVEYSSDSSTSHDEASPNPKRRKLEPPKNSGRASTQPKASLPETSLPTLPTTFYSLYATNVRTTTSDDPTLHAGRTRQVAHKAGNWPTHVYLEWYAQPESEAAIESIISTAQNALSSRTQTTIAVGLVSFLRSPLGVKHPLHISLSAPLVLQTEQKDAFLTSLKDDIRLKAARAFDVFPVGVEWVPNFDRTCYFLVLKLARPRGNDLNRLLEASNAAARKLGLVELYCHGDGEQVGKRRKGQRVGEGWKKTEEGEWDSYFHISIAWMLEPPSESARTALHDVLPSGFGKTPIQFEVVKIKIGNVVHDVALPAE
jgi:U6 snRNA phosphodiesterase